MWSESASCTPGAKTSRRTAFPISAATIRLVTSEPARLALRCSHHSAATPAAWAHAMDVPSYTRNWVTP